MPPVPPLPRARCQSCPGLARATGPERHTAPVAPLPRRLSGTSAVLIAPVAALPALPESLAGPLVAPAGLSTPAIAGAATPATLRDDARPHRSNRCCSGQVRPGAILRASDETPHSPPER